MKDWEYISENDTIQDRNILKKLKIRIQLRDSSMLILMLMLKMVEVVG